MYLAHHELERFIIIININNKTTLECAYLTLETHVLSE